jgi:hypothetical protein
MKKVVKGWDYYDKFKEDDEWFTSMKKSQTEAKIKEDINKFESNGKSIDKRLGKKYVKPKIVYLLYTWHNIPFSKNSLIGAFTTKKEAIYYCSGLNKNEKSENILYYIHPFYLNTNFYLIDGNGNYKLPKYEPKNKTK